MALGDNCSSSCTTRDHASWGECVRGKALHTAYMQDWKGHDATRQKKWDKDLDAYRAARAQGVQPASTQRESVDRAMRISESRGEAWKA